MFYLKVLLVTLSYTHTCMGIVKEVINIDLYKPATFVDPNFLSLAIDSSSIKNKLTTVDFKSKKLIALAKGLRGNSLRSDIFLRIGGSDADDCNYNITNFILNVTEFEEILSFCYDVRWKLIFDLNSLTRNPDGTWDSSNAETLIEYAVKKGYFVDYELGNEPDLYPKHRYINIPPEQLAKDFANLKSLLNVKTRHQSKLYGPDMATLTRYNYFEKFLSNVDKDVLDAITYHHYYSSSDNITADNFTSVEYLDTFLVYAKKAKDIIKTSFSSSPNTPIWIGETSSTYGGGSHIGMSYVAGFLWLDKLGLAAQMNISVVIRQTFKGGKYSLINKSYIPAPDYWISVLYKHLVGKTVLNVTGFLQPKRYVRVYAHCVNRYGRIGYRKFDIVLFILNLHREDEALIEFENESLRNLEVDQYLFSSGDGNLDDFYVRLNGNPLKMINDTTLPELNAMRIKQPIIIPPLQYGYFVLVDSYAKACTYV